MEQRKFYLDRQRRSHDEREGEKIEQLAIRIQQLLFEKPKHKVQEGSIAFSLEMLPCIEKLKKFYEERFKSLGVVSNINWGDLFKIPEVFVGGEKNNFRASSDLGFIKIGDLTSEKLNPVPINETDTFTSHTISMNDIDVLCGMNKEQAATEFRNYIEGLMIAHELYHDSSPTSIFTPMAKDINKDSFGINVFVNRKGLNYVRRAVEAPALEEGLAMLAQEHAQTVISEQFPRGLLIYNNLLDFVCKQDPRINFSSDDGFRNLVKILNFDGESVKYGFLYIDSFLLIKKIMSYIPDFLKLVEQARIDGKTLPLARAIEKRFGKGSYKKIVTCSEEQAYSLLLQLH